MSSALPFVAAIVLVALGAFVPVEALPWVILATMAATMWAVWRFPHLERSILACAVCGFRQELESAPERGGMVVHRCSHIDGH